MVGNELERLRVFLESRIVVFFAPDMCSLKDP